jgi:hypothetical protein
MTSRLTRTKLPLAAAFASAAALYAYKQQTLHADEKPSMPSMPSLWQSPSRSELLKALKENKTLPAPRSEVSSARFDAIALEPETDDSREEGYDLLVIGLLLATNHLT